MTTELLTYANRAKVAEALTAQGYEVTRMTVNRWARGGEMPRIAERMILALFGHEPDAPDRPRLVDLVAQRLEGIEGLLGALAVRAGVPMQEIEAMHQRVLELERSRPQPDALPRSEGLPSRDG